MARAFTGQEIIDRARQMANQVKSAFCTPEEVLTWLSEEYADFYDLLLGSDPDQLAVSRYDIPIIAGTTRYDMPANFYSLVGVEKQKGTRWIDLEPYSVAERNAFQTVTGEAFAYRQDGAGVELVPPPNAGTYRAVYYAAPSDITDATVTIDGIAGWEGYLIRRLALRMAVKEGVPATIATIKADLDEYRRTLLERQSNRKPTITRSIRDVRPAFDRIRDVSSWDRVGADTDDDYGD